MLAQPSDRRTAIAILVSVAVIGLATRMYVASMGHNYDLDSWKIASNLMQEGKNVYANTHRYQYGPVWFLILVPLQRMHDSLGLARLGPESFHIVIAGFLSLVDLAVAGCLLKRWGREQAIFFFLNPISILLTGFHSQIDTLAILPGLVGWMVLRSAGGATSWPRVVLAGVLVGLSITTKHVLVFLPVWLIFAPAFLRPLSKRLVFAAIAFGTAVASFVPFISAPGAWEGVKAYVIGYSGNGTYYALLPRLLEAVVPLHYIRQVFPAGFPSPQTIVFVILMLLTGLLVASRRPAELFERYLCALVLWAPSLADQYLAIPLVSCAIFSRRWSSWGYTVVGTLVLVGSAFNIGSVKGWNTPFTLIHVQIWTAILLFGGLGIINWRREPSPAS